MVVMITMMMGRSTGDHGAHGVNGDEGDYVDDPGDG